MSTSTKIEAKKGFKKYTGLGLSLGVLVAIIIGLLLFNFYNSGTLQKTAVVTIKATQQNGLVQQINNELFQINSNFQKVLPYDEIKERLKSVTELFDANLDAFTNGGDLVQFNPNGTISNRVPIEPLQGVQIERSLKEAKVVWDKYKAVSYTHLTLPTIYSV